MKIKMPRIIFTRFIAVSPYVETCIEDRLVEACSLAYSSRDFSRLRVLSKEINSPAGEYYGALARNDYSNPTAFAIENVPDRYIARPLLSLAQSLRYRGTELVQASRLCLESYRLAERTQDSVACYQAQRELAIIRSIEGDHQGALDLLKLTFPLIDALKRSRPALYFDSFNSVAVELAETGHLTEASQAIRLALASPFAHAYPEWRETSRAITLKLGSGQPSRDRVSVLALPAPNVIYLSERESSGQRSVASAPGSVLEFKAMTDKKNEGTASEEDSAATRQALREEIFHLIANEDRDMISREALQEMVRIAREGLKKKQTPKK